MAEKRSARRDCLRLTPARSLFRAWVLDGAASTRTTCPASCPASTGGATSAHRRTLARHSIPAAGPSWQHAAQVGGRGGEGVGAGPRRGRGDGRMAPHRPALPRSGPRRPTGDPPRPPPESRASRSLALSLSLSIPGAERPRHRLSLPNPNSVASFADSLRLEHFLSIVVVGLSPHRPSERGYRMQRHRSSKSQRSDCPWSAPGSQNFSCPSHAKPRQGD